MDEDRIEQQLVTVMSLAKYLGIKEESLRGMHFRGVFCKPVRIGDRLYWRKTDVDAFLENLKQESAHKVVKKKMGRPTKLSIMRNL